MANINVQAVPSNTSVTVQYGNNITANISNGNNINLQVTPQARQVVNISRGVAGPPGPNDIGGYPINVTTPQPYDALMFVSNNWTNIPQTEIADGGNF
jgi:hypothetical protein